MFSVYNKVKRKIFYIRISSKKENLILFIEKLYQDANVFLERKHYNATQIRNYLRQEPKLREPALGILKQASDLMENN